MLPDLRFVFGATLAVAMLAVAGLGLAISSQLLHEARMSSLEPAQSLAYAGQAEDNPFYDPDSALRFTRALAKPEQPTAQPPLAALPEPIPALPALPEEPTALPAERLEPAVAGSDAEPAPARAAETAAAELPAPSDGARLPDAGATVGNPPIEPAPAASEGAAAPAADIRTQAEVTPTVSDRDPAVNAPPPPVKKPVHHKPRPKVARTPRAPSTPDQAFQNSPFQNGNTQWPSYNSSWDTAPNTKKKNGTVAGR
jgi:hypothetical protein